MTPALLLPGALLALAALIAPLVIHIARRSEQLPIDFAALRWLRQKPRPRSRLRFDEWLLLALRLALLALLALWLAQPVLFGAADDSAYVAIVPGAQWTGAADDEKARVHWLAPGFPELDRAAPVAPQPVVPVASLLRQLDAELPAGVPLTVIVPQIIIGADAERPRLSRKLIWRIAPGAMPAPRGEPVAIPRLTIRSDPQHGAALRYLHAAALAWQPAGRPADVDIGGIDAALPTRDRPLVWLSAGTLPATVTQWVDKGGTLIIAADTLFPANQPRAVLWRDTLGHPLVEGAPMGSGQLMRFTRTVAPSDMPELLEPDFPARLRALIEPQARPPQRAQAADYKPTTGGRTYDQPPQDLRPWLAVLIAALLLIERWFATRRRRAISP